MERQWFIWIEGKKEGPWSFLEIKNDPRITPDTLVWKEGFEKWIAIRHVPEFKSIFKDKPESQSLQERFPSKNKVHPFQTAEVLLSNQDPYFFFWLFFILCITLYLFYYFMPK